MYDIRNTGKCMHEEQWWEAGGSGRERERAGEGEGEGRHRDWKRLLVGKKESENEVAQSCPTLFDPVDL